MRTIARLHHAVEQVFLRASQAALLGMMCLVSLDAVLRYVFARPLQFVFELSENYLMVMVILLPLAFVTRERRHITINVFQNLLPPILLRSLRVLGTLGMIALLAVVTYMSGVKAYEAFRLGETIFGVIDWSVGWSRIWVPLGCGWFMLRLVFDLVTGRTRDAAPAVEHPYT